MIPTLSQLTSAVQGAWRLMLWDRDGLKNFDMTIEGFWRSFFAPLAAFPAAILIYVAWLAMMSQTVAQSPDNTLSVPATSTFLAVQSASFVAAVILFPLLMILITRWFNLTARYIPFIIVWNWVNAVIIGVLAIPHLFYTAGILSLDSIYGFRIIIMGASIFCLYFATWASLETPPLVASMILALGLALDVALEAVFSLVLL